MKINYYFTADHHFGHDNIIKYCNRPFSNSEEMNKILISNYNSVVQTNDIVFFLGDIGLCGYDRLKEIFDKLKGTKILIIGNHDKYGISTYYRIGFSAVLESATVYLGKTKVRLNHYPQRTLLEIIRLFRVYYKKMKRHGGTYRQIYQRLKREWKKHVSVEKGWNLSGHVHEAWDIRNKNLNVGVDVHDFKPISSKEVLRIIQKNT